MAPGPRGRSRAATRRRRGNGRPRPERNVRVGQRRHRCRFVRLHWMSASNSASKTAQDSTGLLGLREMSEALDAWQSRPGSQSHIQLDAAFARAIESSGLGGRHPPLEAAPLTEVELRSGSLTEPATETGEIRTYYLHFGDRVLATLRLDAPPAAVFSVDECRSEEHTSELTSR